MSTFGDFTVTRSTTKRVLNSAGVLSEVAINTPAFEFNSDGTYRGLLVEPAATNLALRSAEFENAYWSKVQLGVTANATVAPDGTTTADKLIPNTVSGQHRIDLTSTATAAVHTMSVYAKQGEYRYISIRMGSRQAAFDTQTGATGSVEASTTVRTQQLPNGWWRFSVSGDLSASGTCRINIESSLGIATNFVGNDVDGLSLWGAQLETGSVATSYIPTVASTQTRTADSVTLTGASSLIGQQEGTLYAEVQVTSFVQGNFFSVNDATASNRIQIYKFTDSKIYSDRISATQSALTSIGTAVLSAGIYKVAFAYKTGDSALFVNGVQVGSTATQTFTFGAMGKINIGSRFDNTQVFNDHIRSVALFPTRLSNAQLATLTT